MTQNNSSFCITLSFPKKPETPLEIHEAISSLMSAIIKPVTTFNKFNADDDGIIFVPSTKHCNYVIFGDSNSEVVVESKTKLERCLMSSLKKYQPNIKGFLLSSRVDKRETPFDNFVENTFKYLHESDFLNFCQQGIKMCNQNGFFAALDCVDPDVVKKAMNFDQSNLISFDGFSPLVYDTAIKSYKDYCICIPATLRFAVNYIPNYNELKKKCIECGCSYVIYTRIDTYFF